MGVNKSLDVGDEGAGGESETLFSAWRAAV